MANIAIFANGQEPQYLTSVNEGDYVIDPNVPKTEVVAKDENILINPDITAVKDVPKRYWKRVSKTIVEMTPAEKSTVDAMIASAIQEAKDESADKLTIPLEVLVTALVQLGNQKWAKGNNVTKADVINAVKALL